MSMNKTLKKKIARTIREKRRQLLRIREEIEDLIDSLDLIEARERNGGKLMVTGNRDRDQRKATAACE